MGLGIALEGVKVAYQISENDFKSMMVGKFYLVYPTGEPVGLDDRSGGYPFKARYLSQVHFWNSRQEAEDYDKKQEFRVHEVVSIMTREVRPASS